MSIFVDTSAWFAAANRKDACHIKAKDVLRVARHVVTSDFVLVETWLLLKNRVSFQAAQSFWAAVQTGDAIRVEKIAQLDLDNAWTIGQRFQDQQYSLVDLTSFVVMEWLAISRVISFDNDFVIYRYGPARDRAFEVLR